MTANVIVAIVSSCVAVCSLIFAILTFSRNGKKDIVADAREMATLNVKLDNISSTVTDIKYDVSATKKDLSILSQKVAEIESSVKSAHHRIDSVEERIER